MKHNLRRYDLRGVTKDRCYIVGFWAVVLNTCNWWIQRVELRFWSFWTMRLPLKLGAVIEMRDREQLGLNLRGRIATVLDRRIIGTVRWWSVAFFPSILVYRLAWWAARNNRVPSEEVGIRPE